MGKSLPEALTRFEEVRMKALVQGRLGWLAAVVIATSADAANFAINDARDLPDGVPGDALCLTAQGTCTLRAAILETNRQPGRHQLRLPAGSFILTRAGQFEERGRVGDLDVYGSLRLSGAGAARTRICSGSDDRVFDVHGGADLILEGLTVCGGNVDGSGGNILNGGRLTLTEVVVRDGVAVGDGGGIDNFGWLRIERSTISGNLALNSGGGLASHGRLWLRNSTLSGNRVLEFGAERGGGLRNIGGTVRFENVTVAGNRVDGETAVGSALANDPGGDLRLVMSIVAGDGVVPNCDGAITSLGHNVDSGRSCGFNAAGDLRRRDPRLAALGDYGGPTPTHALLANSPALDAGRNEDCPAQDQRGRPRPRDGDSDGIAVCDPGAYEAP